MRWLARMFRSWLTAKAFRHRLEADVLEARWRDDGLGSVPADSLTAKTIDMHRAVADLLDALAGNPLPPGPPTA